MGANRSTYTVTFTDIAVTAAQDFFEFLPATQRPIELIMLRLAQTTELGDAQEEQLPVSVIRGHTTSGSGGATVTAQPLFSPASASGVTAERNNTTIASAGTAVTLADLTFNVRSGLYEVWPPEVRPRVANNSLLVVRLRSAPADSITMSGTAWIREL